MSHTKHIWRAVILLILLLLISVVLRHFMIPKSFGLVGHYRYDALKETMTNPVIHGGIKSCQKCHKERQEEIEKGRHASVSCEVCHAPVVYHVHGDKKIADMTADPSYILCGYCHQKLEARPKNFPQVIFKEHLVAQGIILEKIPAKVCKNCHDPHNPGVDKEAK